MENQIIASEVAQVSAQIELLNLEDKLTIKMLAEKLNEIIGKMNSGGAPVARNRGPASERTMTEEDARACMLGELKDVSHKEAAEKLKLSYGQIYSARKGFTFKAIYQEMIKAPKAE